MDLIRERFRPDASLDREEMLALQRDVATTARFDDDLGIDPATIDVPRVDPELARSAAAVPTPGGAINVRVGDGEGANASSVRVDEATHASSGTVADDPPSAPLVCGVDQAFADELSVSAAVVLGPDGPVEIATAARPTEIPYVPGLLSFREGGSIFAALGALETRPAVGVLDGSGRIHYREAGLATHVGVAFDWPTVGVAKSLLCGTPTESLEEPLATGTAIQIRADDEVETVADGTPIGAAVQTRQFESGNRHVNPVYVSPGHNCGAESAADLVLATAAGYKLPEPTRIADAVADEVARALETEA